LLPVPRMVTLILRGGGGHCPHEHPTK